MPGVSNAELAAALSTAIEQFSAREQDLFNWQEGTATGGADGDGRYPLRNYLGLVSYFKSPARLQYEVDLLTSAGTGAVAVAEAAKAAAEAAKTAAETAATAAASSASTATTKASEADNFRQQAASSEANALTHRNAAATSATNAAASEANAESHKSAASTSANNAAASATGAAASASQAQDSATAAGNSATAAANSASAAAGSESSVAANASAAAASASAAALSEDNATDAASAAAGSAAAAQGSADAAALSKDNAAASASAAATSASQASSSKDAAAASAAAAAQSAEEAAQFNLSNFYTKVETDDLFSLIGHTHAIADVVGLQSVLDAKSPVSHTHVIADITGLQSALDNKVDDSQISTFALTLLDDTSAATMRATLGLGTAALSATGDFAAAGHTHVIANVTGLQAALDGKLGATANAASASKLAAPITISLTGDVTGSVSFDGSEGVSITTTVGDSSHGHVIADVSGLQAALDGKQAADPDLTSIAGLAGTSGFLKKTAANTWALDTNSYALASHTHTIANVTGLQAALDGKLGTGGGTISGALSMTGSLTVNSANTSGSGIILSDDGDIVDLNDGYCAMRFSSGVRIHAGNKTGGAVITLGSNGRVTASDFYRGSLRGAVETSANRPGVTKLYRRDDDSGFNVQTHWTGAYWQLRGYSGDTFHAECYVERSGSSGYADSAGRAYPRTSGGGDLNFNWSGQGGQPNWLWGGNDGVNMYVYNPSNFSVNYANGAGALVNSPGAPPHYACRAWVNFNGTGVVAIRASGNVSSISDLGVGRYGINFATAMPDASYTAIASHNQNDQATVDNARVAVVKNYSASSVTVTYSRGDSMEHTDMSVCTLAVFR